jgi:parallel beta helix pectate lyase-like protein
MPRNFKQVIAAAAVWIAVVPASPSSAATITVPAGGDLHAALTNARPGDTIALARGETYVGNFTLPKKDGNVTFPTKDGSEFITIRTAGPDDVGDGGRLTPETAAPLAKLRSPNSQPVIQTAPGAHHWRLVLLELQSTTGGIGNDEILALGSITASQSSLSQVPHDIVVDRCYIHGDSFVGTKRCVALNSAATTVTGSYIADCKRRGQEAQAIAGFNGPGPFTISNNYLEGSGENVMFGGVDPPIPGLVPSDIRITGNLISKPVKWRTEKWTVKNLLELKNARRVRIDHNVIEYNWPDAQSGFAVLFTVRNQDGGCPWCQVEQVVFENNVLRHSAAGISILGFDDNHPSRQTQSITIRNNVFDIDGQRWGGNGYAVMLTGGARDVAIDHNTIVQERAYGLVLVDGPPVLGFSFTNNVARHNDYGIIGTDHAPGNDTISAFFPGSQIVANVIADANPARYPRSNLYPSTADFRAQFVAYESGDYRLVPTSSWKRAGSDGKDLGVAPGTTPESPREPRERRGR